MDGYDFKVDISQCEQFFTAIGDPNRVKKITRKALRKGAEVIRAAVADEAPERPDLPSSTALPIGALKSDIIIRSYTDENGTEVASVQPGKYTDHVAAFVEYGHRIIVGPSGRSEKGYKSRRNRRTGEFEGPGTEAGFVQPNAFFRRGEEKSMAAAQDAIEESLGADLVDPEAKGDSTTDTEAA